MNKSTQYTTNSDMVHLHSNYLLNYHGECWKINNNRGRILSSVVLENDIGSSNVLNDDECLSPPSQPLALWKCGNAVNSEPSSQDNEEEISELESLIAKVELYLLQLESRVSQLKAKKLQEPSTRTTPKPTPNRPLAVIHCLPEDVNTDSLEEIRDSIISPSSKHSTESYSSPCKVTHETVKVKDTHMTPRHIITGGSTYSPRSGTSSLNSSYNCIRSPDNDSMPRLSPFYHMAPVRLRRSKDTNDYLNASVSLPNVSVVISQKERSLASLCTNLSNHDVDVNDECVELNDENSNIDHCTRSNIKFDKNASNQTKCNKESKILQSPPKIKTTMTEILPFSKKRLLINHSSRIIAETRTEPQSINLLSHSLTSSEEQKLFKNSDVNDSDESIFDEPLPERLAIKSTTFLENNAATVQCYVRLQHNYKRFKGKQIFC